MKQCYKVKYTSSSDNPICKDCSIKHDFNIGSLKYYYKEDKLFLSCNVRYMLSLEDYNKFVKLRDYVKYIDGEHRDNIVNKIKGCTIDNNITTLNYDIILNSNVKKKIIGVFVRKKDIFGRVYIKGVNQDVTRSSVLENELDAVKKEGLISSNSKSMFVANMSHEIRTPLTGIIGMTSILQSTELTPIQETYIDIIVQSSGALLSVINNILDFSKMEKGGMDELDESDVDLRQVINTMDTYYDKCINIHDNKLSIYIEKHVPQYIIIDKIKFQQVMNNILSNSFKFTLKGTIKLNIYNRESNTLFIEIIDTGIGISSKTQEHIFEPFVQDHRTDSIYGGTGLGLTICKSLVGVMGGEINLTSIENVGTKVSITIPYKLSTTTSKTSSISKLKDNLEGCFVIVEDNKTNQAIIKALLEKLGHTKTVVFNRGLDFIDYINQDNVDIVPRIILMDLHMPGLDGYETTKVVRMNNIKCPIIAITANAMSGVYSSCMKVGMNDLLIKPVTFESFKKCINKHLVTLS